MLKSQVAMKSMTARSISVQSNGSIFESPSSNRFTVGHVYNLSFATLYLYPRFHVVGVCFLGGRRLANVPAEGFLRLLNDLLGNA
jgi:hypothetical protein